MCVPNSPLQLAQLATREKSEPFKEGSARLSPSLKLKAMAIEFRRTYFDLLMADKQSSREREREKNSSHNLLSKERLTGCAWTICLV